MDSERSTSLRKPEKLQPPDPDESERLVSLESDGSETRLGASKEKGSGKGKQSWPNRHLAVTTMLVSLGGGFVFGYQLLITNPAQAAFIEFVDHSYNKTHGEGKDAKTIEFIWGIIVSSFFWGATIGSLLIQTVSDRLGRKIGILVMFIIQNVACALEILSHFADNYILYSIARILLGIAISIAIGIGPMFIIECSPVAVRGLVSMSTGVLLQCGLVVGSITAMPEIWGTYDLWWAIYGFELILTIAITIMLLFSKESPTYLVAKGKEDQAKNSIVYYHGITESEAEALIEAMKSDTKGEKPTSLFGIFKDKKWLCGFWVGIGIMFGTIMCGVAVVNAFAFTILLGVGLDSLQASIGNLIICIMAVVGVLTSSQFVERLGRRPLLIVTFAALAIINIFIAGFMYSFAQTGIMAIGWGVVVSCCLFNLFFAAGPGPLCFFVPGELICAKNRSATYTWLNIVMNGVRSILLAVYFPIEDALGPPLCYFVLFFPPCFFAVLLCYFYLPETTGLTPEEASSV
ncbi:hypothetical protein Q1695_005026 [Nippostrongylus brasiliensis]|nr:hypothetical protein Q1695_005026 [Nippostrongylus brasiliensis]